MKGFKDFYHIKFCSMKKLMFGILSISLLLLASCNWFGMRTISGNGNIITEKRSVAGFSEVSVGGPFQVEIRPGESYSVRIETDENLVRYINFDKDGRKLRIKVHNGINIRSKHGVKVFISMPEVRALSYSGSGKIVVDGKLQSDNKLEVSVAGSGDIEADVDCPEVNAVIAGSGTIKLSGQTREVKIDIAGSGDFKAAELLSERSKVSIAGSGSAWVFASTNLDISIAGSGDVYYKGNPGNIKKSIAGSGNIKPIGEN